MSNSFPSLSSSSSRPFPLPSIAEDTLDYVLNLPPASSSSNPIEPASLAVLITDFVNTLLPKPWLWNKDAWELKDASVPHQPGKLEGRMRVGDAVDDEWCVVWLLREISRKWPGLVISIRDTDGEFLLIEAANELPAWVSPENAQNRLWLSGGHLHLIPLSIRSTSSSIPRKLLDDDEEGRQFDPEAWISEEDGVSAVRTAKYRTDSALESAVWERVDCYPEALKTHQHRTKAWLPEPIARALKTSPELVQRAAEGFYVRDPAQLRAASRMTHFPPSPSVLAPVQLTRAAYAQLQGQVFHPPRIFGPEWHVREGEELDNERKWRDLGVKIATGFEIMYKEGGRKGRSGTSGTDDNDIKQNTAYRTYVDNLKRAGWFGSEMEGSLKWKEREQAALQGWKSIKASDTTAQQPSFAYLVDQAIEASSSVSATSLSVKPDDPEDSDSWLEVSPDELDGMMMRASGQAQGQQKGHGDSSQLDIGDEHGKALGDLAKKVEEFVGGQGDLQGARFEDELSDEEMDDGSDDAEDNDEEDGDDVDPWTKLTPSEKEERMRTLVAPLDEGEWGRRDTSDSAPARDDSDSDVVMVGGEPAQAATATTTSTATQAPSRVEFKKPDSAKKNGKSVSFASNAKPPLETSPRMAKIRPPVFTKEEYDGVISDSDDSDDELPPEGTLGRKIAMMKWSDGAPQIEEVEDEEMPGASIGKGKKSTSKSERKFGLGDDIDEKMQQAVWGKDDEEEEDQPVIVGEEDVDMGEEEEEFLKFTREALGINEDMWQGILTNRREKGAFVPGQKSSSSTTKASSGSATGTNQTKVGSSSSSKPTLPQASESQSSAPGTSSQPASASKPGAQGEGQVNMDLNSFDSVMAAMDAELARTRGPKSNSQGNKVPYSQRPKAPMGPLKSLPTEADLDDMADDDLEAMDRELKAALKSAGIEDDSDDDVEGVEQLDEDGQREFRMMKDFLESYKSQGGDSGVIGNLFGRLGEKK